MLKKYNQKFTDTLLLEGMISREQYDQLVENKVKFLNTIESDISAIHDKRRMATLQITK